MTSPKLLDCGHPPSDGLSPYSIDNTGFTRCLDCSNKKEVEDLRDATRLTAYLSGDEKAPVTSWHVTGFAGAFFGRVVQVLSSHEKGGYTSSRYYYFRMQDIYGHEWTGSGHGPGTYCRLRRLKER
jgi:hypothetical protein